MANQASRRRPLPVFWGSWFYPLLPRRDVPLNTVMGKALHLEAKPEPTDQEVAEVHEMYMRELEAAAKTSAPFLGKIYKVPPGHPDPKTPAPAAENIQVYTPPPGSEPYVSKFFPLPAPRRLEGLYPLDPLCCTHHKHDATSSLEVAHEGQMSASALAGFL